MGQDYHEKRCCRDAAVENSISLHVLESGIFFAYFL
jgi:hypothetical protein